MITNTQDLILKILGIIAVVTVLGVVVLLCFVPGVDVSIMVALVGVVTAIVGGLIGFLNGKSPSDSIVTPDMNQNVLDSQVHETIPEEEVSDNSDEVTVVVKDDEVVYEEGA